MSDGQNQREEGAIYGTVVDASGASLPGVMISIVDSATQREKVEISDARGQFRALSLSPGSYTVKAQLEGFQTYVKSDVQVAVGGDIPLRITMNLADIED